MPILDFILGLFALLKAGSLPREGTPFSAFFSQFYLALFSPSACLSGPPKPLRVLERGIEKVSLQDLSLLSFFRTARHPSCTGLSYRDRPFFSALHLVPSLSPVPFFFFLGPPFLYRALEIGPFADFFIARIPSLLEQPEVAPLSLRKNLLSFPCR